MIRAGDQLEAGAPRAELAEAPSWPKHLAPPPGSGYDAVGNRTTQTLDEGSGPTVVASTYDDRDRLLTAAATSYGWDTNGNLTSQDGTSYGWDFENRLTSATLADGTVVETTYDADGNRVRTSVTTPGGGAATVVDYLIDTTGFLGHVVADIVGGQVQTLYTRADDQLIGLYRPVSDSSRYYHADGLGSVRVLSDEAGEVTDRYKYTAFGELPISHGAIRRGGFQNIDFADLRRLVEAFGFARVRISGSHHIFSHAEIPELVNLQEVKGQAKPYQIRQFLRLIERYNLILEDKR